MQNVTALLIFPSRSHYINSKTLNVIIIIIYCRHHLTSVTIVIKALAQIILCLLPIATICTLAPFSKYNANQLEGRWYVQSIFSSDGVDEYMDIRQCFYIDFDTSNKSYINATFTALHGYEARSLVFEIYLPTANGSAVLINKYANDGINYLLEVIDTSSVQPWKDDETFAISILLI